LTLLQHLLLSLLPYGVGNYLDQSDGVFGLLYYYHFVIRSMLIGLMVGLYTGYQQEYRWVGTLGGLMLAWDEK